MTRIKETSALVLLIGVNRCFIRGYAAGWAALSFIRGFLPLWPAIGWALPGGTNREGEPDVFGKRAFVDFLEFIDFERAIDPIAGQVFEGSVDD